MKTSITSSALAAALLLACGGEDTMDSGSTAGELLMGELNGGVFLLESAEGYTPVEGTTIRVSFDEGGFGFSGGCNSHGGDYSVEDGSTLIVTRLGSTAMGCDAPLHDQDTWLAGFFTERPTLDLEGAQLTVSGAEATLIFLDQEIADPDRALAGTLWTIDTVYAAGTASGGWNPDPAPTVTFGSDGNVSAQTPCGRGSGTYTIDGDAITLANIAYVEETCSAPEHQDLDTSIRDVLTDGQLTYEIEAASLTLMRGDIGLGARAE